jgi:hypothetical protein
MLTFRKEFLVNGTDFPQVPFDIGESYAGLLSNAPHGNSSLWFWFFPSENPAASKEVCLDIPAQCRGSLLRRSLDHYLAQWWSGL